MDHVLTAAEFIARTGREPLEWGRNDCACWAASYWHEATGFDPAAPLRGTYNSWMGCRRILMAQGGTLAVCRKLMAGIPTGGTGDGICVAKAQGQIMAGILSNGRLWLKGDGMTASPDSFDILERWAV